MAVRKRCQEDGCKRGDHRCDHPWWFDVMHNGKRHRVRVNDFVLPRLAAGSDLRSINTRTCAEAWEPRFLGEVQAGRDPRVPPNAPTDAMTVLQLIADYRSRYVEVEPLRSRHSIHSSLNVIARFFGSLPVRALQSPASIEDFKKQYAPGHKAASVNRHLARLRHLIGWAIGREVLSITPFRRNGVKLNTRDEEQRSRRVYPDEEARLLGACAKLDVGDYRFTGSEMKDRFIGALETGCRRGEMLKIRNLDVDWTKHRIALPARNTKSAKGRVIPFDPQGRLAEVLRRRRFLGPDAFVFGAWMTGEAVGGFRGAWESVMLLSMGEKIERADRKARANTKALKKLDLHWHDLRHECASRWRENGLDLEVIRRLLGHSTLLVTQRYLNINEDELVEAMQQKIWKRA